MLPHRQTCLRSLALSLLLLLLLGTTSPTAAEPTSGGLPLEMFLTAEGNLNLPPEGVLGSIDPTGFTLISGPNEPPRFAPSPTAMTFATDDNNWDPRFFSAGLNNTVMAVAWDGVNLYMGGSFTSAGLCLGCNRIARWDGTAWHPLGNGVSGEVSALAWTGTDLYVGGSFGRLCSNADCSTTAIANGVINIARWDGTTWHSLANGVNGWVYALAWTGTDLYVGGDFTRLCSNADCSGIAAANGVNRIARWDGTTWHSLGNGVAGTFASHTVFALAWTGTDLYVGGWFTLLCSNANCSTMVGNGGNRIARWDGSAWHPLGNGVNSTVRALAWTGTDLYIGGEFNRLCSNANCSTTAAANGVNRIARWDGSAWHPFDNGVNSVVRALAWTGTDLYAGGNFTRLCSNTDCSTTAATNGVNRIARWDGSTWHALDNGLNGLVYALAWTDMELYAGGLFTRLCADVSCADWLSQDIPPHKLAHWMSSVWIPVGEAQGQGLANNTGSLTYVTALVWTGQELFVGGGFTHAGLCEGCNHIARWDGNTWHPLSNGVNFSVRSLVWTGSDLYVGGDFRRLCSSANCSTTAATNGVNRIARWDGNTWHPLGNGVNSTVYALAWTGTDLYVGGDFSLLCNNADCSTTAATNGVNRIARWDGNTWHPLGNGVNSTVQALTWTGTDLYVGGWFGRLCSNADCSTTAAANGVNQIARWNGSAWHALGNGVNQGVRALAWTGTQLYVGGQFTYLCNNADCSTMMVASGVNRIARWNGSTWNALDNGVTNITLNWVSALAWTGTDLYVGGNFTAQCTTADCGSSTTGLNRLARWDGTTWHNLSSGVNNQVNALVWDDDSLYPSLYAGGNFAIAGAKASVGIGRWRLAAIWDGGGGDNDGTTAANWSGNTVPLPTDVAIFDRTSSKDALLNSSFPTTLRGLVIEDSYGGVITPTTNLGLTADLQIHGGVLTIADPTAHSFTVGGDVAHTGGTLRQTRPVTNASVPFLLIDDGGATVKYRGVLVDTTGGGNDLGAVTVGVRAINPATNEYCTSEGASSPVYAARCYEIAPTTNGPAKVRLWAQTAELNGIGEADLTVYRYVGGVWQALLANRLTGSGSGGYHFGEGDTAGFSHFLLGEEGSAPTAVALQHLNTTSPSSHLTLILLLTLLVIATLIGWAKFGTQRPSS